MIGKLVLLSVMLSTCFGLNKDCNAIPKQLRIINEQLNRELNNIASRLENVDCSLTGSVNESFENGGWELIFRATAGNDVNTYQAWVSGKHVTTIKPKNMRRSCGVPYRNSEIDKWASMGVEKVKFAFFEDGKEVAHVMFNGKGSDSNNWFSKERIESSSWCDLRPNSATNFFSIAGHSIYNRRFFINFKYDTCGNDQGHAVIIDPDAPSRPCMWERYATYPQFLYARTSTKEIWDRKMFGRADHIGIFIQRSTT